MNICYHDIFLFDCLPYVGVVWINNQGITAPRSSVRSPQSTENSSEGNFG